ncbi:gamma-glutamylcyclotransferase family protein [Natronobeatus ordinarius]|uniref:gamma-glutamylcyclotransferase family protein n=1 Tax=Natronobeatus ordinarius TaxID=2963433 RepID=UPI0020CE31CD|nr:gamma-glutamylcyclotransferase family protein [Natronobeatus ordinarius]
MLTFVYGTLTDSERVAAVLEGLEYEFAARATLEGCHRVDGRYPTLAPGGSVEGRLLAVDRSGLEAVDAYEGVDAGLYVRIAVPLEGPDESLEADSAWTYVGRPDRLGVADRVTWPGSGPFADRVRRTVERDAAMVVSHTPPYLE